MSKSFKFKENNFLDSSGVVKGRETLNQYFEKRIECYNDTSANDVKELLRNKISSIETQLANVTNGMMFLNGGWYGRNYGMAIGGKQGGSIIVFMLFHDGVYVARKLNNVYSYIKLNHTTI